MTVTNSELNEAYNTNAQIDLTQRRANGEFGNGWTEERLATIPIWHIFPGYKLEAKYDNRLTEDVTVVSVPQHDNNWNREYMLVENEAGERYTLSSWYKTNWYPTVPQYLNSNEGFFAQTRGLKYSY